MRLAPGASVPQHSDINYHWMTHLRVHIPIVTRPGVRFTSGGETVHMGAGEAWTFDNWRAHDVVNDTPAERVHLVADTVGNAQFWGWINNAADYRQPLTGPEILRYQPSVSTQLQCERQNVATVMPPAEVELLIGDLLADLSRPAQSEPAAVFDRFVSIAVAMIREWRSLWARYGEGLEGWVHYSDLRQLLLAEISRLPDVLRMTSNGASTRDVMRSRVLMYAFHPPQAAPVDDIDQTVRSVSPAAPAASVALPTESPFKIRSSSGSLRIDRPVFIVAAPRSGSSLLFETLAKLPGFHTLGGEGHRWIEGIPELRPFDSGLESNRLTAAHATEPVKRALIGTLGTELRDRDGASPEFSKGVRFLEKTPKNSLRIPFFTALFPDARFIFLHRDPQENIGSIMDAWQAGGWVTYPELPGWDGPWSLLLPPDWQSMRGRPLEEIAAFQWSRTNEIILEDLAQLPQDRWTSVSYADFLKDPMATVQRLASFAGVDIDAGLADVLAKPLPLSAHTLAPPEPGKWRRHEAAIERVLPSIEATAQRLRELRA
jgi:hypothetical protein